jgi:hypothetical protein
MVHSMTGIYWWKMVESEIVLCCFGVGMGRFEVRACGSEQWFARLRRDGFKWRQGYFEALLSMRVVLLAGFTFISTASRMM